MEPGAKDDRYHAALDDVWSAVNEWRIADDQAGWEAKADILAVIERLMAISRPGGAAPGEEPK